jgi:hypothetical protein
MVFAFCLSVLPSLQLQGWICGFVGAQTSQATAARESTLGTLIAFPESQGQGVLSTIVLSEYSNCVTYRIIL